MYTMRISCPSAQFAVALSEALNGEGYAASWLVAYESGRPVVVTDAPRSAIASSLAIFGMGL